MYPYGTPVYHPGVPQVPSSGGHLRSTDVTLILRQQPKEALVTTEGKEKARKPVDPPPIVQLTVRQHADPQQHFLQSPYLFMCTSLYKVEKDEAWESNGNKTLAGSLVSSLHRLKDVDNKDGGFFVFGDISVKVQGHFRLHFSLFDLRKETSEVAYLGSITSEPFRVLQPKDFKGMDESTYLSRAFSDQGVRLRLRKEPRAMMGNKRPYPYGVESNVPNTPIRPNMSSDYSYGEESSSPVKRFRSDTDTDTKVSYPDHSGAGFQPSYGQSHYTARPPSLSGMSSMASQYPAYNSLASSSMPSYQSRPSIGGSSSLFPDSSFPTSGAGSMATQRPYDTSQQSFPHMFSSYGQQRGTMSSSLSFSDDAGGLSGFRAGTSLGLGDEGSHRPATATGIAPSLPMAHHTPQSQHSSHQSHDSIGSSRGASFSHSPDMVRNASYSDRLQLGSQLPNPNRSIGRYEDHPQMSAGLYTGQRNHLQAPSSDPNLTRITDSGAIQHSIPYNPDSNQSTEGQGPENR